MSDVTTRERAEFALVLVAAPLWLLLVVLYLPLLCLFPRDGCKGRV
jgi:hypothetical protein